MYITGAATHSKQGCSRLSAVHPLWVQPLAEQRHPNARKWGETHTQQSSWHIKSTCLKVLNPFIIPSNNASPILYPMCDYCNIVVIFFILSLTLQTKP